MGDDTTSDRERSIGIFLGAVRRALGTAPPVYANLVSPVDKIRRKHQKEGIADFENCVKCHRSASEEAHGSESRDGRERD